MSNTNAKAVLAKMAAAKIKKPEEPILPILATPAPETPVTLTPPVVIPNRICNYWTKALNTEIALNGKEPIKFKGNSYQTSDSHEIYTLDELCSRMAHIFKKV